MNPTAAGLLKMFLHFLAWPEKKKNNPQPCLSLVPSAVHLPGGFPLCFNGLLALGSCLKSEVVKLRARKGEAQS